MIVAALVHVMIHWNWVMSMGRRMLRELLGKVPGMNWPARKNLLINAVIAFSFTLTALSGVVFVFFPGSGADHSTVDFLFPRGGWDMIHTWAGVVMILSSIVHFMIHWRWVVNVTLMIFRSSESQLSVR